MRWGAVWSSGLALEGERAPRGVVETRQAVEESGLSGAVRTDQPHDLVGGHVERHPVERHDPAEAHGDVADREDGSAAAGQGTGGVPRPPAGHRVNQGHDTRCQASLACGTGAGNGCVETLPSRDDERQFASSWTLPEPGGRAIPPACVPLRGSLGGLATRRVWGRPPAHPGRRAAGGSAILPVGRPSAPSARARRRACDAAGDRGRPRAGPRLIVAHGRTPPRLPLPPMMTAVPGLGQRALRLQVGDRLRTASAVSSISRSPCTAETQP